MQMEMSYMWAVVITGLVVVFLGLVLLIAFISIVGKIFSAIDKSKKNKIVETPSTSSKASTSSKDAGVTSVEKSFSDVSDDTEVVAAISAAIMMMGIADNTTYKIKSIKAVNNARPSRSAWTMAGLNESTSPF